MPSRYDFSRFASTPSKGDLLFHYTTVDALLKIVESAVIFASHIQYLNDSAEFTYAIDRIQQELRSMHAEGEFAGRSELPACIEEFESPRRSRLPAVYVTSFSEERDLLSQWRAYAPRGGVSIGFNAAGLAERAANHEFWLAKCVYEEADQRELITKTVREFLGAPATESPNPGSLLYGRLVTVAPAMKDPSFKEEAEWRLISYAASSTDSTRAVGFRSDGSMVIPYCRVPLNSAPETPVDLLAGAIIVGPTPHPEISKRSIELMLYKRNIRPRPRVENSKVPYRNW